MNSNQRSVFLTKISDKLLDYLKEHEKLVKHDHAIKSFVKKYKTERANVEIAFSILINKGLISLDKEFHIKIMNG
jgi:hypothetical protein